MAGKKTETVNSVGKKIKKARTSKKITLAEIANDTGFSTEYIKEIETGKSTPSVGTLLQIAKVLKLDSGFLLKEEKQDLKKRIKEHTKRTENYAYETMTPGSDKHLKAFKITIDPLQEHKGVGYCHEGEEFVYVIKGTVEIIVGDHKNVLKKNDTLHFNSGIKHQMTNIGKSKAELLVVVYAP